MAKEKFAPVVSLRAVNNIKWSRRPSVYSRDLTKVVLAGTPVVTAVGFKELREALKNPKLSPAIRDLIKEDIAYAKLVGNNVVLYETF